MACPRAAGAPVAVEGVVAEGAAGVEVAAPEVPVARAGHRVGGARGRLPGSKAATEKVTADEAGTVNSWWAAFSE